MGNEADMARACTAVGHEPEGHPHAKSTAGSNSTNSEASRSMPIAICGIGMRMPGGLDNPSALYDFLAAGRDARAPPERERFASQSHSFRDVDGTMQPLPMHEGYWLSNKDVAAYDPSLFMMSQKEAMKMDPVQHLLLQVSWEALESAAEKDWEGKNIGCYVGSFGDDWREMHSKDDLDEGAYRLTGYMPFAQANRVSYALNLHGPSMTLRTACSAAGLAVHLACQGIRAGDCDSALVAGANVILSPGFARLMAEQGVLSPDASCKTFDAEANGYARADAASCLFVKRLDHAIRDGNPVRAIIRGSATNSDGKKAGLTTPSPQAQEQVIRAAYRNAGINDDDVCKTAFVECHGTGTAVGDMVEGCSIGAVFGDKGIHIGSVKPNLGHSEGASALTSIIKSVVSLERQMILPNIKFKHPNPRIPFKSASLQVPTTCIPWPTGRLERVSINSFGIGGTNVHIILDSAASFMTGVSLGPRLPPSAYSPPPSPPPGQQGASLLVLSAGSEKSLKMMVKQYMDYLQRHPAALGRLAYTLAHGRPTLPFRTFCVAQQPEDLNTSAWPTIRPVSGANRAVFVFTGQGAQWPRMGAELIKTCREFREDIKYMDAALKRLLPASHRPRWTISGELLRPQGSSRLGEAEFAQPACTVLQVALIRHLGRYNIFPAAVVGHSSGEIAAAFAAGVLSMEEAAIVAYYRGWVVQSRLKRRGSMAAVGLGREQVTRFLEATPGVSIACENSNRSVTLSGDAHNLQDVLENIKVTYKDVLVRALKVDAAYHSHHMKEIGDEYRACVTPLLRPQPPKVPFISSVTGEILSEAQNFKAEYWQRNLENPVLFRQAVSRLLQGPLTTRVHLEVGPHSALAGPLKHIYDENALQISYLSVLKRATNDSCALLAAVGHLHCLGTEVQLPLPEDDDAKRPLTDLPSYPWDLSRTYWPESRGLREWQAPRGPSHELLGQRVRQVSDAAPQWRCALSLESVPWIDEHRIRRNAMFPAAAYIAMAGEVVHQLNGAVGAKRGGFVLRDLNIHTALVMQRGHIVEMVTEAHPQTETGPDGLTWWDISISSFLSGQAEGPDGDGTWTKHCTCRARASNLSSYSHSIGNVDSVEKRCVRRADPTTWYKAMARVGYNYGPRFRGAHGIRTSARSLGAVVHVALEGSQDDLLKPGVGTGHPGSCYTVHPIAIDHVLQAMIVAIHGGQTHLLAKLWLPVRIEELFVGQEHVGDFKINVKTSGLGCGDAVCRPVSHDDVDNPMSYFKGIRLSPVESLESGEQIGASQGAIELVWKPDIDLISPSALVQRAAAEGFGAIHSALHELSTLCVLDLQEKLPTPSVIGLGSSAASSNPHLVKQYDWLKSYTPNQDMVSELKPGQAAGRMDSLARKLNGTSGAAAASLVMRCHAHAHAIFNGDASPLDLFLQDNALHHLYDWMNSLWSYQCLLQLLSHQRGRNLKILEIGAGTGGLTARVLRDLKEEGAEEISSNSTTGERAAFGKYVFTDVSAGFFPAAKKRFAAVVPSQLMEYRVLDVSRPPQEQGFGACEYDLVIASNVLHATPDLTQTLRHVRSLLKPDGRLLLQELACGARSKWVNFVMGFLPGWWLGQDDARSDEPCLAPEFWHSRLLDAGFGAPELVVLDADAPVQLNATMLARPSAVTADADAGGEAGAGSPHSRVTLLMPPQGECAADSLPSAVMQLEGRLLDHGHMLSRVSMGQSLNISASGCQRHVVVSAIDLYLQDGWFSDFTAQKLASFQRLVGELQATNTTMLWLTQHCQMRSRNPCFAQCLGVARTVRAELGVPFATIELDVTDWEGTDEAAVGLEQVSRAIQSVIQRGLVADIRTRDGGPDQDMELAYCSVAKAIVIPRAYPMSVRSAIQYSATRGEVGRTSITTLRALRPGSLENLEWTAVPRPKCGALPSTTLPPGAVRIRVQAAGLNFKDVMASMGLLGVPSSEDAQTQGLPLGCEAAGVVTAVGGSALSKHGLGVGDRVVVFAPQAGCFSAEIDVDARLCARIPERLSMCEAAGLPCIFTTVLRGLADKAGLGPGQTVLVHSGAGGVGLAALQVAQHLGVAPTNIYATAGSDEKRAFLAEQHGLPPGNIFSSRDDSFVDGILAETRGRGVDVVLNSLSGDLLHASWGCVAAGGTFVELGKRDVNARARLAMAPFDDNRSFVAVDMARLAVQDPSVVGRLLEWTLDLYGQRAIAPVQPLRRFGCAQVRDAFRQLSKPSHVGKVVIDMSECGELRPNPNNCVAMPASAPVPAPELDPEAVYLLVGGLGGLGTSISRWMASHGAKALAILSRSGSESETARDLLAELLEMGCKVTTMACDVTDDDAVREAMSHVSSSTQRRVAGVLFLPMVLADAALSDMTVDKWRAATDPKIRGSWNVHNSLPQQSHLDFFVLFGSTSGFCGYPGQANYAAANAFLDAFAQYRRGLGLPCSVVDVGPVEDVGHVSKVKEIRDTVARSGARFVSERQMLEAVQLAMLRSKVTPSEDQGWGGTGRGLLVHGQLGVGFDVEIPLTDARNSVVWKRDARMVMLGAGVPGSPNLTVEPGPSSGGLTDFILHLRSEPTDLDSPSTLTVIAREIASRLFSLLSRELDTADEGVLASVSLESLGIDSLVTIEVRSWWKRTFCSQVSSVQLVSASNFLQLAALAITHLREAITK